MVENTASIQIRKPFLKKEEIFHVVDKLTIIEIHSDSNNYKNINEIPL